MESVQIADGTVSVEYSGFSRERMTFRWTVTIPAGVFSEADLRSGMQGADEREMIGTLLSFLSAAGEAVRYCERTGRQSGNEDLFPPLVSEWARENTDKIEMAREEVEDQH